jgi:lysophospholipase L1-like esterase
MRLIPQQKRVVLRTAAPIKVISLLGSLGLSAVAIISALLVLEVAIRFFLPQNIELHNWLKFQRPSPQPGGEYELIPNAVNDSYRGGAVHINSLGLRDREVSLRKPTGTYRILAIGDSVTFGSGVRLEDTYVKRLESLLNEDLRGSKKQVEVLNAGIGGTGLPYYLNFLQRRAADFEPDLVVVGICLNDILDYAETSRVKSFVDTAPAPSPTVDVQMINRFLLKYSQLYLMSYVDLKSILYRIGVLDLSKTHAYDFVIFVPPSPGQDRAWKASLSILDDIVAAAKIRHLPLMFVVFPMEFQLGPEMLALYVRTFGLQLDATNVAGVPQQRLVQFGRDHNVSVIDLLPTFRESRREALYLRNQAISHDWIHFSPQGHQRAAEGIFHELTRDVPVARSR